MVDLIHIHSPGTTEDGKWYWYIDDLEIGYAESVEYDTEREAWAAMITGKVVWDEHHFQHKPAIDCWCGPVLKYVDGNTGGQVWVHWGE